MDVLYNLKDETFQNHVPVIEVAESSIYLG